jgi:hypothetical protein
MLGAPMGWSQEELEAGLVSETFSPIQIGFGVIIGFLPGLAMFYLEGRRLKADRIRQQRLRALDATVGSMNKLLDAASAALASTLETQVHGVLPHDPLAYFESDPTLIPDHEAATEMTALLAEVLAGGHREDRRATSERLTGLMVRITASARKKREELAAE